MNGSIWWNKIMCVFRRVFGKIVSLAIRFSSIFFRPVIKVLMLHHIGEDGNVDFNISNKDFLKLVDKLMKGNVVPIHELHHLTKDSIILTIDDVPYSFYKNAFPVLVEKEIPFTVFVSVELLDQPGYITTEILLEMASSPLCTIGSHGVHHSLYYTLTREMFIEELQLSKKRLESIIHTKINYFAFPYGSVYATGLKNISLVSEYYDYGFSTLGSSYSPRNFLCSDNYIPRIDVNKKYIDVL